MNSPARSRGRQVGVARPSARSAAAALTLDAQLCFALYGASLAMTKRYRPLLEPLGLTYPQYLVMLALWEEDGPSVSALGARLGLDSGTLTPLLKRLETQQLLQRLRATDDERRVHVRLTGAGRMLRRRAQTVPTQMATASGCALDELRALTQTLHQLRRRLAANDDEALAADSSVA